MNIDELLNTESIRQTRILGSRHLDSGDWESLAALYTADAICEFGPYGTWTDQSAFATQFRDAEEPFVKAGPYSNLHAVVNHVVTLTGADTATGLVYLMDFVTEPSIMRESGPLFWLGVYDEQYRKVDGRWQIARQSLNFIWPERNLNDGFVERHASAAAAPAAPRPAGGRADDAEEIRQLSARYAAGLDSFDMDALLVPFADDIVFDAEPMGLESYSGTAALREFFGHNLEVMADQMHLFSNFVIDFDGPDAAHGSNYLLQDGHTKDGSMVKSFCRNEDTYRRVDGRWQIATRRITPLMPPELGSY